MKRFMVILVSVFLMVTACSKKEERTLVDRGGAENAARPLHVTATIFPPFDFTREIAGDRVNLTMLLPPGSESHSYEPTPKDIITVQKSDVFIYVGGESDAWVDRVLSSMDTGNMTLIKMMDAVQVVEEELVEGMEDAEGGEGALLGGLPAEYDEHVWTSPQNAILIVRAIAGALCTKDPGNAGYFRQRAADYAAQLEALDASFREVVQHARRKTLVFGDRFPFRYFADAYGLAYFAAFPGCSTETEPSAATVAFLIDTIKAEQIPVIFHIELSNERMADAISEASGAKKRLLHAGHTISKQDFESGVRYITLQTRNVSALQEALQ
jgi:zinc transport system substrate-binding protein